MHILGLNNPKTSQIIEVHVSVKECCSIKSLGIYISKDCEAQTTEGISHGSDL